MPGKGHSQQQRCNSPASPPPPRPPLDTPAPSPHSSHAPSPPTPAPHLGVVLALARLHLSVLAQRIGQVAIQFVDQALHTGEGSSADKNDGGSQVGRCAASRNSSTSEQAGAHSALFPPSYMHAPPLCTHLVPLCLAAEARGQVAAEDACRVERGGGGASGQHGG